MTHNIAVIGGDGIGPEVTAEAVKVVRAAGVPVLTTDFDLGGGRYLRDGEILSDETLGKLAGFDIDFIHAICKQMKAQCEIVEQNWDGLLPGLQGR